MSPKLPTPVAVLWSENRYDDAQMLAMYHQGRREAFEEVAQWLVNYGYPYGAQHIRSLAEKDPK